MIKYRVEVGHIDQTLDCAMIGFNCWYLSLNSKVFHISKSNIESLHIMRLISWLSYFKFLMMWSKVYNKTLETSQSIELSVSFLLWTLQSLYILAINSNAFHIVIEWLLYI